jgi:uncharacterized protein (TIGR02391 family)
MSPSKLQQEIDQYLVEIEASGFLANTVKTYRVRLQHFASFAGAARPVPTAPEIIYGYLDQVAREGGSRGAPAAPGTIAHAYAVLRAFYKHLAGRRRIDFNPMFHVASPALPRSGRDRPETITASQLDDLLDTALNGWTEGLYDNRTPNRKFEDHILVGLFGLVGLTVSEVTSLTKSDVQGESLLVGSGAKRRSVGLPVALQSSLIDYVAPDVSDHLFGSPADPREPLPSSALNQRIPRLAVRAGIDGVRVTPKLLRDTRWTIYLSDPERLQAAMSLTGLASSESLMRYLPDPDDAASRPNDDSQTERLHQFIRNSCGRLVHNRHYSEAVGRSGRAVLEYLRIKTDLTLDGDQLITEAFGPKAGVLRLNEGRSQTDRNEALGFMNMFQGFNQHVRNVHSHKHHVDVDPECAIDYLTTASLICRVIDRATFNEERPR